MHFQMIKNPWNTLLDSYFIYIKINSIMKGLDWKIVSDTCVVSFELSGAMDTGVLSGKICRQCLIIDRYKKSVLVAIVILRYQIF